jgi:hypothetical protein
MEAMFISLEKHAALGGSGLNVGIGAKLKPNAVWADQCEDETRVKAGVRSAGRSALQPIGAGR